VRNKPEAGQPNVKDATWLVRLDPPGDGARVAVKDCIDVAGTPTTVGCRAIAEDAVPAAADAPVVESARRQGARIVGKTNLVELCRHADGVNSWTGTPQNPLDPTRIPGGSSSGSAVAVARDEADVGYGTDTGGSVRVPAACCGIVGLKTSAGRISTQGVFEFSRTLDTVGVLARDVSGAALGMRLMEPGFPAALNGDCHTVGRLRIADVEPGVDAAVDAALASAGFRAVDVDIPEWRDWISAANDLMSAEGFEAHRFLLDRTDQLEQRHARGITEGGRVSSQRVVACRRVAMAATDRLRGLLAEFPVLALPTLAMQPPRLGESARITYLTVPLNLCGLPALALPVPRGDGGPPASLQLVSSHFQEEWLLAVGADIEAALADVARSVT
jgi:amidase